MNKKGAIVITTTMIIILIVGGFILLWTRPSAKMNRCLIKLAEEDCGRFKAEISEFSPFYDMDWNYICKDVNVRIEFGIKEVCICNPKIEKEVCEDLF